MTHTLYVILTVLLVDNSLTVNLHRNYNIPLLHLLSKKSFQYEIEHRYFTIRSDFHYITFPDDKNVLSYEASSGHFLRLNNALHPVDKNDKGKPCKHCQFSILNQNRDQAICIDKNFLAITVLGSTRLFISFLTFSYPLCLRHLILYFWQILVKKVQINTFFLLITG